MILASLKSHVLVGAAGLAAGAVLTFLYGAKAKKDVQPIADAAQKASSSLSAEVKKL